MLNSINRHGDMEMETWLEDTSIDARQLFDRDARYLGAD